MSLILFEITLSHENKLLCGNEGFDKGKEITIVDPTNNESFKKVRRWQHFV